jgi:integrase
MRSIYDIPKLTIKQVQNSKCGRLGDGEGLWLETSPTLKRRFLIRFSRNGKVSEKALGLFPVMTLAGAREAAMTFKRQLARGVEPQRKATFAEIARDVVLNRRASFKSGSSSHHRWEWLYRCAKPLHDLDCQSVTVDDVVRVLKPYAVTKPATCEKLRGFIEAVMDASIVRGLRTSPNPATWKSRLSHVMPKRVTLSNHNAALSVADMPAFIADLRLKGGTVARALVFTVLTCARKSETLALEWSWISDGVITMPASAMKQGREHRVPLSGPALAILNEQRVLSLSKERATGDLVFPNPGTGRRLHPSSFNDLMKRMGSVATPHGAARASFSVWAQENTDADSAVIEGCLSHVIGNATTRAYLRSDNLAKRRELLGLWADFLSR